MAITLRTATLVGLVPEQVIVEATVHRGLPAVYVVGLPDAAVRESVERVRGALRSAGFDFPRGRLTISLGPAEIKKSGAHFDLVIALAVLGTLGVIKKITAQDGFLGQLGLDGSVRPVRGVLPLALGLQKYGAKRCFFACSDAALVTHVPGLEVVPVKTISGLVQYLVGGQVPELVRDEPRLSANGREPKAGRDPLVTQDEVRLDDLVGLHIAKRALLVAAAGGHNLLFVGPPGTGKTVLARCLQGILPELDPVEQREVNAIWSAAGRLSRWMTAAPFRAPHHAASSVSLLGGGNPLQPGDVSLAHHGVLFMDELPEFRRDAVEQLRQPLEEGQVRISRAAHRVTFPAGFQLVAAANPCPCGYAGDDLRACTCTPAKIALYRQKLSGPLLDRIDIVVRVPRSSLSRAAGPLDRSQHALGEHERARAQVAVARERQVHGLNAKLSGPKVRSLVTLDEQAKSLLEHAENKLGLSPRGFIRVLRVARTIADLAGREQVVLDDVAEALQYRPELATARR